MTMKERVLGSLAFVFVIFFDYVCAKYCTGLLGTHICTAFYVFLFRWPQPRGVCLILIAARYPCYFFPTQKLFFFFFYQNVLLSLEACPLPSIII